MLFELQKYGEPCCEDFYDVWQLASAIGPSNLRAVKWADIKVIKIEK